MKVIFFAALVTCLAMVYSYTDAQVNCPVPDTENATLLPDPTNCSSYFACLNGQPIRMWCPEGTHFNPKSSTCDWPWRANCTARS